MNRPIEYQLRPCDLAEMAGVKTGERLLEALLQVETQQERIHLLHLAILEVWGAPNHGDYFARGLTAALVPTIEAGLLSRLNGGVQ